MTTMCPHRMSTGPISCFILNRFKGVQKEQDTCIRSVLDDKDKQMGGVIKTSDRCFGDLRRSMVGEIFLTVNALSTALLSHSFQRNGLTK